MNELQEAILLGAKEIHKLREQNKKYKQTIDKIKEYAKANKIIEIIALLEVEEIE